MNPEHLFEQAESLIQAPAAGRPRQVDLRRAISAAYYALFHAILAAAADLVIGTTRRSTVLYELVYRSIDHRALKDLCTESNKTDLNEKICTLSFLIHPNSPLARGRATILRERHGTSIASSDDDTAAGA